MTRSIALLLPLLVNTESVLIAFAILKILICSSFQLVHTGSRTILKESQRGCLERKVLFECGKERVFPSYRLYLDDILAHKKS